jgi:hypothetical protein
LAPVTHYLIGRDRALWRTHVSGFGRVVYEDVYPRIDLVFRGTGQRVEFV